MAVCLCVERSYQRVYHSPPVRGVRDGGGDNNNNNDVADEAPTPGVVLLLVDIGELLLLVALLPPAAVAANVTAAVAAAIALAVAAAIALAAAELRGEGPTSAIDECDEGEGIIEGEMWLLTEGLLLATLTVRLVSSASCDTQKQTNSTTHNNTRTQ